MFYVCMTLSKYLKQQNCEATFNTNYLKNVLHSQLLVHTLSFYRIRITSTLI